MRGLFIVFQEELGFQENIKILVIRNNKIMTGQPTHTPRGAFDSFQGLQVASKLDLNLSKRSPRHHTNKHTRGAPQGPKPGTRPQSKTRLTSRPQSKTRLTSRPQSKTQLTSMTTQDSNRPCKAQTDQQCTLNNPRALQVMDQTLMFVL